MPPAVALRRSALKAIGRCATQVGAGPEQNERPAALERGGPASVAQVWTELTH
jgi:hypothetical protein